MKSVFTLFATLGLALMTFIGGLAVVSVLMSAAEPSPRLGGSDVVSLWTNEPVRIDPAHNDFERLPGLQVASEVPPAGLPDARTASRSPAGSSDAVSDGAVSNVVFNGEGEDGMDTAIAPSINEAHLDWCSSRYRSYRPRDNSYTAYSGGRRECISPFPTHSAETVAAVDASVSPLPAGQDSFSDETFGEAAAQMEPQVEHASLEGVTGFVTADHAQSCFARYRSYTAEDNTYQPYGGGPRVQCE